MMEISGYQSQSNANSSFNKSMGVVTGDGPQDFESDNDTGAIAAVGGVGGDSKAGLAGGLNSPAIDVKLSEQEPERVRQQAQQFDAENAEAVTEPRPELENFTI